MLLQTGGGTGVNIADETGLERNSFVEHILSEITQFDGPSIRDGDVVNEPCPVTDAVCPAVLDRLPNRLPKPSPS